jgi:hypothetical protein
VGKPRRNLEIDRKLTLYGGKTVCRRSGLFWSNLKDRVRENQKYVNENRYQKKKTKAEVRFYSLARAGVINNNKITWDEVLRKIATSKKAAQESEVKNQLTPNVESEKSWSGSVVRINSPKIKNIITSTIKKESTKIMLQTQLFQLHY